jgi:hypothetical protein
MGLSVVGNRHRHLLDDPLDPRFGAAPLPADGRLVAQRLGAAQPVKAERILYLGQIGWRQGMPRRTAMEEI